MKQLLLVVGLMSAMGVSADETIEKSIDVDGDARISVENIAGEIVIQGWDQSSVQITAKLYGNAKELLVSGGGSRLDIEVDYESDSWFGSGSRNSSADLMIYVPANAVLDVESVSAEIDVVGVTGSSMQLESVSGDVEVESGSAEMSVATVSGEITIKNPNLEDLNAESVSGDIRVQGGMLDAILETVSGDIQLSVDKLVRLEANSVSGDIKFPLNLQKNSRVEVETVSGDIRTKQVGDLSAEINAESFSGDIRIPGAKVSKNRYGPGAWVEQTFGNGDASIDFNTHSGDIEID